MQKPKDNRQKSKTKHGTPVIILADIGGDNFLVEVESKGGNGITMVAKKDLESIENIDN
jgi:hypothetical protein